MAKEPPAQRAGHQPTGMMTTEVQVPLFPLQWRCKTCRLHHTHPEIFDELTRRLVQAEPRKTVLAWLAKQGVHLNEKHLARHYQTHLLPYFSEALEVERRLGAEAKALGHLGSATIASALARTLAMRALTAVHGINFEQLAVEADPNLLFAINKIAETIARIDSLAADTRLKERLVQLRQIELDMKAENLDRVAARWILLRLQERPEAVRREVLRLLELPTPQQMKALPEPEHDDPDCSTKRSRVQRPHGTKPRAKR
jgi:hypothetical protein